MRKVDLICVGKLKSKELETIENDYIKRISSISFRIHEVKANGDDNAIEAKNILKKIESFSPKPQIILMTERGEKYDSPRFSDFIFNQLENNNLVLIIAGALGFHSSILELAHQELSLSPLTFPHKLARIILVEQIYRAITIKEGHPYHN